VSKFRFDLTHASSATIEIEADDGALNNWKDLTAPSCLMVGVGNFEKKPDKSFFSQFGTGEIFYLFGSPFNAPIGSNGEAKLILTDNGCDSDSWSWERVTV
jgi:hypothetical protein